MYPRAPQLWQAHGNGVVGVDEIEESFRKIDNGVRLTSLPAYQKVLSPTQMGQIAWLVKSADKSLSPEVRTILQDASR